MTSSKTATEKSEGAPFDARRFSMNGFHEPIQLLSNSQRELLVKHSDFLKGFRGRVWNKELAVHDRLTYDIATDPLVLAPVRKLLGEDIILWGASFLERVPGQVHTWHVDLESAASNGKFVSLWIGLENCSDAGLAFIAGSHGFEKPVQQLLQENNVEQSDITDEVVLSLAREMDANARLVEPEVSEGDILYFHGRIWHGSRNRRATGTRRALLLQYASADMPILKPKFGAERWPFKFEELERPPVLLVNGSGNIAGNARTSAPANTEVGLESVGTRFSRLRLPIAQNTRKKNSISLINGHTEVHDAITCHASVLPVGEMPHPPHCHIEEELLIILEGEGELMIGASPDEALLNRIRVKPYQFGYYPAYRYHTLKNCGDTPLTYLMFKWRGPPARSDTILSSRVVDVDATAHEHNAAKRINLELDQPTNFLSKLHVHISAVEPGGGYDPHRDGYDVAIVVLDGRISIGDRELESHDVAYFAANEPHGLRNDGKEAATYLVFEFHQGWTGKMERSRLFGKIPKRIKVKKPLGNRIRKHIFAPARNLTQRLSRLAGIR